MGAAEGNQNAAKKGPTRLDVHISIADKRRAKLERYMQQMDKPYTEQDMKKRCKRLLYDWIDHLP